MLYCYRTYLNQKSPIKNIYKKTNVNKNQLSPFNIDTPNRRKILKDGLPFKHGTFLGSGGFGTVYKASYKGKIYFQYFCLSHLILCTI